jgi:molecular chaperone GrpE (heat shock protein)
MTEETICWNETMDNGQVLLMKEIRDLYIDIDQIKNDLSYLKDLFIRRLNDDKQKSVMIQKLAEGASFAYIEPFLTDLILVLDRLEKRKDDDFVLSVYEELYDILRRRGVEQISKSDCFDPKIQKAVKVNTNTEIDTIMVTEVLRNGYMYNGKVIRSAEVAVDKPEPRKDSI